MKHSNMYRFYTVPQDLINFLRGDGVYHNRLMNETDKQVYSHYGVVMDHPDKYIGIIIEFQNYLYFAPITHDGDRKWANRNDCCDFERIYNENQEYIGSLLLCKALPLTNNLVKFISIPEIAATEGHRYANLCRRDLAFLNKSDTHCLVQEKMQQCIYGHNSPYQEYRIDYLLAIRNIVKYNVLNSPLEKNQ